MPINPKTITVFLDSSASGRRRAAHAAAFAQRWGAHLVGVYVVFKGVTSHPSMAYARSEKAIAGVIAHERRVEDACECTTAEVGEHFQTLCAGLGVSAEFRPIQRGKTAETAIINSLHSDLLVIGHPEPSGLPDDVSAERMLLASGVPLLIVPNDWRGETIGEKVMIGWNASPEARRAVSDAMCLLVAATSVTALIVDPAGCKWLGGETGCDISQHLGRHGAHVAVEQVASRGRPIAEVILDRAMQNGSDLLVVGARNPAHLAEMLFGNATRTLLTKMPVPVMISR
ncbi:MAG TPA: universal stress protein [Caulobacteraceae bacterium]|jgi:nucleotide-binding universal stress UspA family protein